MGQVSTFTIGDLVVPVVVEAYRTNWFPAEDVLLAKTSSHEGGNAEFRSRLTSRPGFSFYAFAITHPLNSGR